MMRHWAIYTTLFLGVLTLSGCEMHHPSYMTENRIQVQEQVYTEHYSHTDFNAAAIANLYDRQGDGPLHLTVTYDPLSKTNTAMHAGDAAAAYARDLRKQGVALVESGILPIKDSGEGSKVFVGYQSYSAQAPKDCGLISGLSGNILEAEADYKLGCSVDTVFARQIARPSDLAGQSEKQYTTDGRRSANIIETYRAGAPNDGLDGESASD